MDAPNATTSGRVTAVRVDAPETAPARKATMKAIVQDRYGPPDVLELREIDQPTVKDNQVVELPAPMPPRWSPSARRWSRSMTGRSYLGPACCRGVNGLLLGYLMYRSGLVPRAMALLGLIGGPVLFASGIAVLFGLYEQVSVWSLIATVPVFAWEASLGIYLMVKGFKPSPITAGTTAATTLSAPREFAA